MTSTTPQAISTLREALKPCPFCGGEAKRITLGPDDGPGNDGGDVIVCTGKCGCSSHVEFGRKENLVSLWNERTQLEAPPPVSGEDELALREARSLAVSLFNQHYRHDEAYASGRVKWEPLDDLRGLISQIDNMTAGLSRSPVQSDDRLREDADLCNAIDRLALAAGYSLPTALIDAIAALSSPIGKDMVPTEAMIDAGFTGCSNATAARYAMLEATPSHSQGETPEATRFDLTWTAAPRPPVHPNPMQGRQSFPSFDDALAFVRRQPADSTFGTLFERATYARDRSDEIVAVLEATPKPESDAIDQIGAEGRV